MRPMFLDTVGIIAVFDERDQWHAAADSVYHRAIRQRRAFITTELVLAECANAASRKPYRHDIVFLRQSLARASKIAQVTTIELENAWDIYSSFRSGSASVVDITSFIVMRRLKITDSFTNDSHFKAAGFLTLF